MVKIGFIGMGNMGNAILNGLLKTHGPEEMIFSAARQDKMEAVTVRTKVPHACSNRECAEAVKYLILAVKPQYFDAVFSEIRDVVTPEQVVVSLAPGISISNITERLGGNVRVVRAMPNTPAMLGEGMTGVWGSILYRGGKGDHPGHLFLLRKGGTGGRTAYGCSWLRQRQFTGFCVHVH